MPQRNRIAGGTALTIVITTMFRITDIGITVTIIRIADQGGSARPTVGPTVHMMGSGMMWGIGLIGLFVIIVLLSATTLVKYLFFSRSR